MAISLKQIQALRLETGRGVMEIKRALEQTGGKVSAALELLEQSGRALAARKAVRSAQAGVIEAYLHHNEIGVLVEVNCETDFVARNAKFRTFSHDLALQVAAMNPKDPLELLAQPFIKDATVKIEVLLHRLVAEMGENIQIKRFVRFEIGG